MVLYTAPLAEPETKNKPEITADVLVELSKEDATRSDALSLGSDALRIRYKLKATVLVKCRDDIQRTAVSGREGLPEPVIDNETGKAWVLSER